MSDLQIVLIVIGAFIICAVIIINWWQERRFHKQVDSGFSTPQSDALLDDPKLDVDLVYDQFDEPAFNRANTESERSEPQFTEPVLAESQATVGQESASQSFEQAKAQLKDNIKEEIQFNVNPDVNVKLTQRDDIKAIFNEAFNLPEEPSIDEIEPVVTNYPEVEEVGDVSPVAEHVDVPLSESPAEPSATLPAMLHAQMDLSALLYLATDTPLDTLLSSLNSLLQGYDKPVFVHVLDTNHTWHLLGEVSPNTQVTRVACSIQLADRGGPVSRQMLNRFQLAVESTGLDINAHVEWQSSGDALATAIALDAFCIEVDKTMGFHLVHGENGPFTGTKLRGLSEAQGLTLGSEGIFKFFDVNEGQQAAFVMFNRDDHPFSPEMLRSSVVKGVTFQLDIPHVRQCAEAFSQMVQVARQMEIGLGAVLVDDNNKVLGDIQIEKIRQQLKVIHATMLVRGIVPGTDSAHRLFS